MIDWKNIKKAADVSLQEMQLDLDKPDPYLPEDKQLIKDTMKEILKASGQASGEEDINDELYRIAVRGKPYIILEDGKPAGIGVTGYFDNYDDKTRKFYSGQSVNDLGLLPQYQNHGTGRAALKLLIKEMMKQNPKWLHIAHANINKRAGHLYRDIGFSRPLEWDNKATSLHMKAKEAKKLIKQWNKETGNKQ